MEGNLFAIISPKTFVQLASKYQDTYPRALQLLREKVEDVGSIDKKAYHDILVNELQDIMDDEAFAKDEELSDIDVQKPSDNAHRIIKRLEQCCWIYIQYDEDECSEKVILREHARILLETIDKILYPSKVNYKCISLQIYSQLYTADKKKKGSMYQALEQAASSAESYRDWLINKSANIKGEYLRRSITKEMSARENADEYLNNYTAEISKAILEPIKTYDDPSTYKQDMLNILWVWRIQEFEQIVSQGEKIETELDDAVSIRVGAKRVLLFENKANCYDSLQKRKSDDLMVFESGFLGYARDRFFSMLYSSNPDVVFYHSVDIDAGGLEIFTSVKRIIPTLKSLHMDIATFIANESSAIPLLENDRKRLGVLRCNEEYREFWPLIYTMLEHGKKLEQGSYL